MNRTFLAMIGSVVALAAMVILLARDGSSSRSSVQSDGSATESKSGLMFFCAASNRAVIEEIRAEYEQEFGRNIEVQYGASQTLLSQMEVSGAGDLYLPADDSYLEIAGEKELVAEILPIARMQGVIAVKRGNPKSIESFQDLLRDDGC